MPRIRWSISLRLTVITCSLIVAFGLAMSWLYQVNSNQMFENRRLKVKHQVETAWGVLDHFAAEAEAGRLSTEEAQAAARAAVKGLRYGEKDYFWINDLHPRMVMHPFKPELDGKDLSASQDPDGKKLFVEFVEVCRKQGEGFVDYLWPKPGFKEPVPKISFVKLFPQWGWIIGNGLYIDDLNAERASILTTNIQVISLVVLATAFLTWLFARSINRPLRQLTIALGELAMGHTDIRVPVGKPVNCSQKRDCGEKSCPSFAKDDLCWITSGSFAVDRHCPRAKRGEDCRKCNLYGARNEMEDLGSSVQGLANALKVRSQLAQDIASGDLTKPVVVTSERDQLGQALARMHGNLCNILCQVKTTGEQIDQGSGRVAATIGTLSDGAASQAASLEQIGSSVTQMASQTRKNADNASQASELAGRAHAAAESSNRQMNELVAAMAEINASGQNISKIIKVIDEIAFQTNLLALNAAVEAARAGQHGKGFAVVAEEVRNLAGRSARAAQETAELIEGSAGKATRGAQMADRTAEALGEIVTVVTRMTDLAQEIAAASHEQAQGIDQINQGLTQIDQVAQSTTAHAEETAATAEALAKHAHHLGDLLKRFHLDPAACAQIEQDRPRAISGSGRN